MYLAKIYVTLKSTINDPQGQTVLRGLNTLGFSMVAKVRVGKYLEIQLNESNQQKAEALISNMCHKLLSNPVIEDFRFDLEEATSTITFD
jgi:phosphoribosylformylglycinamidine synthase PurS subunit